MTGVDPHTAVSLNFSTYLGISALDAGTGITSDAAGNPFVTGFTRSTGFPTFNAVQPTFGGSRDAFLTQLDGTGSAIAQPGFLGGAGDDLALGIALDTVHAIYLAGGTASLDFPVTGGAFQPTQRGNGDAFVARIQAWQSPQLSVANCTDGAGAFQFTAANFPVGETSGTVNITVTRVGGSNGSASVRFATSDGSATAGVDYSASTGTLSFASGQTSRTFAVTIRSDAAVEADETLTLTLSNPTGGAVLGTPSTATLTIVDDD